MRATGIVESSRLRTLGRKERWLWRRMLDDRLLKTRRMIEARTNILALYA